MDGESEGPDECLCVEETPENTIITGDCTCPRNEHDLVEHRETCYRYQNQQIMFPGSKGPPGCECREDESHKEVCDCCSCPVADCQCNKPDPADFQAWRNSRKVAGAMPPVLESSHPLLQKFQDTLKIFLEKENALAQTEIMTLKDELRLSKERYDKDLEYIYRGDQDTNAQRSMIEEYEANLAKMTSEREHAEKRAKEDRERYKKAKHELEQQMQNEKESLEELSALERLCRQLAEWREETESDLVISQKMSEKMKKEKKVLADEKRELDMMIFSLNNEIWKMESSIETINKQIHIKSEEMEKVTDKVTAYAAELEDLELDKRRLVSLWNSLLVNIKRRDNVYDSVREDYKALQENFHTLDSNLEITKKIVIEEMNKGKEIAMEKDKLNYDLTNATKLFDTEDAKRLSILQQIEESNEAIEMLERDTELIKSENFTMNNILKTIDNDYNKKLNAKIKIENDILQNIQESLLNDKCVESMANGIKKMRALTRKQEIVLMNMENSHAKMLLEIEVHRSREEQNKNNLEDNLNKVRAREHEVSNLEEAYEGNVNKLTRKQRELDIINKKYAALVEEFGMKSPQDRHIEEMELQIKLLRERAEELQFEWLRLQGHVVKLAAQYEKLVADVNLINKQVQICDQKIIRLQADLEAVNVERVRVDRTLRDLGGKLQFLQRSRKEVSDKNLSAERLTNALSHEYMANLKGAEADLLQLEEDIEEFEREKINLGQELDRKQREALIWQRKGILALELKRNISCAKSTAGEIGQMKSEIHRMEVRRDQLRRIGEKLSDDLAQCVSRRESAMEKVRAVAAVEKATGSTSQSQYCHKLRLVKSDVARLSKEVSETKGRIKALEKDQERYQKEIAEISEKNMKMEENVADLIKQNILAEREKQWLLERVIRNQRLSTELGTALKRQSVRVRKPREEIVCEYSYGKSLNAELKSVAMKLQSEFPFLEDKLEIIKNTLNIFSPGNTPSDSEDEGCPCQGSDENVAEKPLSDCS